MLEQPLGDHAVHHLHGIDRVVVKSVGLEQVALEP
jgi:hypothetical protein